jgi:hypothetical protein
MLPTAYGTVRVLFVHGSKFLLGLVSGPKGDEVRNGVIK